MDDLIKRGGVILNVIWMSCKDGLYYLKYGFVVNIWLYLEVVLIVVVVCKCLCMNNCDIDIGWFLENVVYKMFRIGYWCLSY